MLFEVGVNLDGSFRSEWCGQCASPVIFGVFPTMSLFSVTCPNSLIKFKKGFEFFIKWDYYNCKILSIAAIKSRVFRIAKLFANILLLLIRAETTKDRLPDADLEVKHINTE